MEHNREAGRSGQQWFPSCLMLGSMGTQKIILKKQFMSSELGGCMVSLTWRAATVVPSYPEQLSAGFGSCQVQGREPLTLSPCRRIAPWCLPSGLHTNRKGWFLQTRVDCAWITLQGFVAKSCQQSVLSGTFLGSWSGKVISRIIDFVYNICFNIDLAHFPRSLSYTFTSTINLTMRLKPFRSPKCIPNKRPKATMKENFALQGSLLC